MKQFKTIMMTLMMFAALSCSKNRTEGFGYVDFEVSGNDYVADCTRSNVSDYTTLPSADAFTLKLQDSESTVVYQGLVSEWDSTTPLIEGEYTVTASYGSIEEEGFDKPYFIGTQKFIVKGGETVTVSIPVNLGNTIIKIDCSDTFRNYYKNYSFKLLRNGAEIASFAKDETKAAFVDGYKFTLQGTFEGEMKSYKFEENYTCESSTAYTFHFDVTNVGGATITIRFNDTVETVQLGDYELND